MHSSCTNAWLRVGTVTAWNGNKAVEVVNVRASKIFIATSVAGPLATFLSR